jgi:hypothetical protein
MLAIPDSCQDTDEQTTLYRIDQTTTGTVANEIRQEPPVHPGADRSNAKPTASLELAMRVKQEYPPAPGQTKVVKLRGYVRPESVLLRTVSLDRFSLPEAGLEKRTVLPTTTDDA